jgi:hypothetical protein
VRVPVDVPRDRESGVRLAAAPVTRSLGPGSVDELRTLACALHASAVGFEVCARRARTQASATRMTKVAANARAIAEEASARVPGGVRRPTTSERMGWEWLASTAALLDGGAEGRLADEANRHLAIAVTCAARIDDANFSPRVGALAAEGRKMVAGASGISPTYAPETMAPRASDPRRLACGDRARCVRRVAS